MKKSSGLEYAEKWYHYYKFVSILLFVTNIIICPVLLIRCINAEDSARSDEIISLIIVFALLTFGGIITHMISKKILKDIRSIKNTSKNCNIEEQ